MAQGTDLRLRGLHLQDVHRVAAHSARSSKQDQLRCNCLIHRRPSEPRRQERPVLARQLYAIHRRRRRLPAPHFLPRRTAGIIRVADAPHKTGETEPEVKIPTKSPQHTRPTSPTRTLSVTHLRWSEARYWAPAIGLEPITCRLTEGLS
jgi:hypothetical protein